jgi:hypothetical protein
MLRKRDLEALTSKGGQKRRWRDQRMKLRKKLTMMTPRT